MKTEKKPCHSCNKKFKPLDLIEWRSTYKKQDGTIVPIRRELCSSCYAMQATIAHSRVERFTWRDGDIEFIK